MRHSGVVCLAAEVTLRIGFGAAAVTGSSREACRLSFIGKAEDVLHCEFLTQTPLAASSVAQTSCKR